MLGFEERSNRRTRRKTARSRVENQQTQSTYDVGSEIRTRDTLMEGGRSHDCANPDAGPKCFLLLMPTWFACVGYLGGGIFNWFDCKASLCAGI